LPSFSGGPWCASALSGLIRADGVRSRRSKHRSPVESLVCRQAETARRGSLFSVVCGPRGASKGSHDSVPPHGAGPVVVRASVCGTSPGRAAPKGWPRRWRGAVLRASQVGGMRDARMVGGGIGLTGPGKSAWRHPRSPGGRLRGLNEERPPGRHSRGPFLSASYAEDTTTTGAHRARRVGHVLLSALLGAPERSKLCGRRA